MALLYIVLGAFKVLPRLVQDGCWLGRLEGTVLKTRPVAAVYGKVDGSGAEVLGLLGSQTYGAGYGWITSSMAHLLQALDLVVSL